MPRARSAATTVALAALVAWTLVPSPALADESGVSFWLPGQYASLASAPGTPGWTVPFVYYHVDADAGGSKDFPLNGRVATGIEAEANLLLIAPTYVFAKPVAGGQAALGFAAVLGAMDVTAEATLTGPGGTVVTKDEEDDETSNGDLYPVFSLRWNHGVHNSMWYVTAGVPVGEWGKGELANLGTNHWAVDSGAAYTFFNPKSGHEFSITGGLTYNFENPVTDYQSGIDAHVDLAWSEFVTQQTHVGIAAYAYHQITGDSGDGAVLGDFESEVYAIGPQVGHIFPVNGKHGYFNFRAYYEFGAENRIEGWNAMFTVAIPVGQAKK